MSVLDIIKHRSQAVKTRLAEVYNASIFTISSRFPACPHSVRSEYPHLYAPKDYAIDWCWAIPVVFFVLAILIDFSSGLKDVLHLLHAYPKVNTFFLTVLLATFIVNVGSLRDRPCSKPLKITLVCVLLHGLGWWIYGASPRQTSIEGAGGLALVGATVTFILVDLNVAAMAFLALQECSGGSWTVWPRTKANVPAPRNVPSRIVADTPEFTLQAHEPAGHRNIAPAPTQPAPIMNQEPVRGNAAPVGPAPAGRPLRPKRRSNLFAARRRGAQQHDDRPVAATRYAESNFLVGFAIGKMARAAGTHIARQKLRNIGKRPLPRAGLLDRSFVPPLTPRLPADEAPAPLSDNSSLVSTDSSAFPGTPKMASEPDSGYTSMPTTPPAALGKKGGEKVAEILARLDKAAVQQEGTVDGGDREAPPARQQKRWIRRVQRLGEKLKS